MRKNFLRGQFYPTASSDYCSGTNQPCELDGSGSDSTSTSVDEYNVIHPNISCRFTIDDYCIYAACLFNYYVFIKTSTDHIDLYSNSNVNHVFHAGIYQVTSVSI